MSTLVRSAVKFCLCFLFFHRNEKGIYYALDLGGTNIRVLRVQLGGSRSMILRHEVDQQPIPQNFMTGTTEVNIFTFLMIIFSRGPLYPHNQFLTHGFTYFCRSCLILLLWHWNSLLIERRMILNKDPIVVESLGLHVLFPLDNCLCLLVLLSSGQKDLQLKIQWVVVSF